MNRILVILPNWFGETLFATPFLHALRQQRPDAFIATLGWPACRHILLHNPAVDELLDLDEHGLHRGLAGAWRRTHMRRARRFDTAFILRRSLSRTMLTAAAGVPRRVGMANVKSGWLLTHRAPSAVLPRHKAMTYLPLLEAVGLSGTAGPYEYVVSDEERREARERLRAASGPRGTGLLVVLHPGANWAHKRWPADRFAELGRRLVAEEGARVIITGGPDDVALAQTVAEGMSCPVTVLAGQTTVRQLGAILDAADLLVSNDTGVTHIAAALHRPLVALYGPTSPALTGPLGDPNRIIVIHHPEGCPAVPCYSADLLSHPGMAAIPVDEVYDAVRDMLVRRIR